MKIQLKADLMLVVVTLGWGISYYLIDICLDDMGAFTLNAYRFLGAFFVIGTVFFRKLKNVNKLTLIYSALLGTVLLFVYIGATFGVKYTSLSNAGFLCALSVIFTPIIELIVLKKVPEKKLVIAVAMSLIGIMLLTLNADFTFNTGNLKGDLLCIMCGLAYAVVLIITDKAVNHPQVNAFHIGVFQLGFTGLYMLVLAFIFENPHLPGSQAVWVGTIFLSLFCTGLAFVVQAIAQQYTSATHVGIIFTLEPVFAAVAAFFLAGEVLTGRAYIGGIIMLMALFVMETNFIKFSKKLIK